MLIPSGALYLDTAVENLLTGSPTPICINAFPFDSQDDVPAADADGSHYLYATIVDIGTDGLDLAESRIYVTTADAGVVQIFDGAAFIASWAASTFSPVASDGGATVDEHRFVFVRDTAFVSLDVVQVRLVGKTTIGDTLDKTYSFTIEDLTKPEVLEVKTRTLTKLVVQFNEPVACGTGEVGDASRVRDISGGIGVLAPTGVDPARIIATRDIFDPTDVGLFLGVAGSENAVNNDIFTIVSFISAREVEIGNLDIISEDLPEVAIITLSPYRVDGVPDEFLISPYFNPLVIAAECVPGDGDTVELTLHTEITQQRLYTLHVSSIQDLNQNVIEPTIIEFTTESCGTTKDRDFSVFDMIPDENLNQDDTRDLIRFLNIIDEVLQLILCSVDEFVNIMDIDLVSENNLDAMLAHLGNPFSFATSLSTEDKRRLASVLVEAYKRKGGEVAIEATVAFILGIDIDVQPFLNPAGSWTLGVSELGTTTLLGPGTDFLLYSFQAEIFQDLTEIERRRLIEIVEYMKPAHTHFIRLIEPTTPPVILFSPWALGIDLLGDTTILG